MKRLLLLSAALLAVSAVGASAYSWTENFDGYADQAAFNAAWQTSGTPVTLDTDGTPAPPSSPNSVLQGTTTMQSRAAIPNLPAYNLDFSFKFYDAGGATLTARAYAMVYSYSGAWGSTLQQIIAIGKYNSAIGGKYWGRVAFGAGNWVQFSAGPTQSIGWHDAQVKANIANGTYDFYIDGQLAGTQVFPANNMGYNYNFVVVGSNLASSSAMQFDDIKIVPEPGSLLALGAGLTSFVGLISRRRR